MSQPIFITDTIAIHAPAIKVWDAITNPEQTKKYMFGCEALSDWKPGSPLIWKGTFNGVEMIPVKGKVVSIDAARSLVYTVIDPDNPKIPDLPENYLTITYKLTEDGDQTVLDVSMGDFDTVAEGPTRYKQTMEGGGWNPILVQIKALCES